MPAQSAGDDEAAWQWQHGRRFQLEKPALISSGSPSTQADRLYVVHPVLHGNSSAWAGKKRDAPTNVSGVMNRDRGVGPRRVPLKVGALTCSP